MFWSKLFITFFPIFVETSIWYRNVTIVNGYVRITKFISISQAPLGASFYYKSELDYTDFVVPHNL